MLDQPDAVYRCLGNGSRINVTSGIAKLGGLEENKRVMLNI